MHRSLVIAMTLVAASAQADEPEDLVRTGEELAKQGEWSRAIEAFKKADANHQRASHACLIGLAYTRRELWAQAELFLRLCRERITVDDPAPEWLPDAEDALREKLAASNALPVTVSVEPTTALASISLSSFAPDETFTPRTLHLARGSYTVQVSAPGFEPASRTFAVLDRGVTVKVGLMPLGQREQRSRWPWVLGAASLGFLATAATYHVVAALPARHRLDDDTTNAEYERDLSTLTFRRRVTYALYGAGAATAIATVLAFWLRGDADDESVRVTVDLGGSRSVIGVAWSR